MQRNEALVPLSHDHHAGLFVAQRLKRAEDAGSATEARNRFLSFWGTDGRRHFRIEEDVLLPSLARHVEPAHEAVVRVLVDHVELRRRAADLERCGDPSLEELHQLGRRLEDHIRHEERVLFPLVEQALPPDELAELAEALRRAEGADGPAPSKPE
jgi:hemerythrin-like domain-containing protein